MATNLDLDDELVEQARQLGRHRTKQAAINEALAEYVASRKGCKILELFGKVEWDPDYDYMSERRR
jgi:Arc/MetJ family transcription regulator